MSRWPWPRVICLYDDSCDCVVCASVERCRRTNMQFLVRSGYNVSEIAEHFSISERTVQRQLAKGEVENE